MEYQSFQSGTVFERAFAENGCFAGNGNRFERRTVEERIVSDFGKSFGKYNRRYGLARETILVYIHDIKFVGYFHVGRTVIVVKRIIGYIVFAYDDYTHRGADTVIAFRAYGNRSCAARMSGYESAVRNACDRGVGRRIFELHFILGIPRLNVHAQLAGDERI